MNVPRLEEIPIMGLSLEMGIPTPFHSPFGNPCSNGVQDQEISTLEVVKDTNET